MSTENLPPLVTTPTGRYRHYKGMEYQVLDTVRHSETCEPMTLYRALYGECGVWVRPMGMFFSPVDKVKYPDVKQVYRFERVGEDA